MVSTGTGKDRPFIGYARKVGSKWLVTQVEDACNTFRTYHAAAEVQQEIAASHNHNRFTTVTVERVDLCDSILEDIDNLSVM